MAVIAKRVADALNVVLRHSTWTGERDVLWGNGSGTFIVPNPVQPREVYYHNLPNEEREVGIAVLDSDSNLLYQENTVYAANPPRITIGYPPRSRILHVKGVAKTMESNQVQGNASQIEQYLTGIANPGILNIVDLRVRQDDTPTTSVYIEPGFYEKPSALGIKQRWAGGLLDLATPIAALTSTQHQLAIIYLDTESAALGYNLTTATSSDAPLPARSALVDISGVTLTSGRLAVGTVYLYYGQTSVTQDDCRPLLDPRLSYPPLNNHLLSGNAVSRTIASGAFTSGQESVIVISPESGSSDDLDTLTLSGAPRLLVLYAASSKTITIKNGTGNLYLNGGADYALSGNKRLLIWHDGTNATDLAPAPPPSTVNTTDATPTTLATVATTTGKTYSVEAVVTARCTGGAGGNSGKGAGYRLFATFRNVSGTVTQIGSTDKVAQEDAAVSGWDADFTISSTNILVGVTGGATDNASWDASYRVRSI